MVSVILNIYKSLSIVEIVTAALRTFKCMVKGHVYGHELYDYYGILHLWDEKATIFLFWALPCMKRIQWSEVFVGDWCPTEARSTNSQKRKKKKKINSKLNRHVALYTQVWPSQKSRNPQNYISVRGSSVTQHSIITSHFIFAKPMSEKARRWRKCEWNQNTPIW